MPVRRTLVVILLAALLVVGFCASLALGAVHVPVSNVIDTLLGHGGSTRLDEIYSDIVLKLRLPRTIEAIVVGAALGVAGAMLQGALANPLASPDVIGVTGGAGFGALLIILIFPGSIALLPIGALGFGLLAAALVFIVAWSGPNGGSITRLILAGIAMMTLFGALTAGMMALYPDRVPSAIFFLAGGFTTTGWDELRTIAPYFAVGFVIAVCLIRPLDRLSLGDDVAASLGTRPRAVRLAAGVSAALLAAGAAAIAGLIGFLGLVVPHIVRLAGGTSSHGYVVPVSALGGSVLLVLGDTLARNIRAPIEMPVGPLMVLLGVPLFLWLLRKAV